MPTPSKNETKDHYMNRCLVDSEMNTKHPDKFERYAVCSSMYRNSSSEKISFDYDGVLSTNAGKALADKTAGNLYIISARSNKESMLATAKKLGIPSSNVYATGSNKAKIEKIKELGISKHYDNNPEVVNELKSKGKIF